ncbi:MAG TPA: hypothetical protein VLF18_08630 [Tahibacter sp.]|uniref:hypothetical protein n=1 Tax=Tahibacter sp. TaxID=2056211 RepID=UPI002BE84A7A|nr:hypothetical protein [Tahibacter sp.]HSX60249.1 hypothetical protein [Tahibacter sp.]
MSPVRIQVAVYAALAALAVGLASGWTARTWYGASKALAVEQRNARNTERENARRREIGAQHARDQRRIEDYYDGLPNWWKSAVAERPAVVDCELGADGLRQWNAWNAGPGADRRGAAAEGGDEPTASAQRPP